MDDGELAYVFWHWRREEVPAADYEARQVAFHRALADAPPSGFRRSWSVAVAELPWTPGGGEAYEDWYLVDGFADLEQLNHGAVRGARQPSHDRAATVAEGGAGGIYRLKVGDAGLVPTRAWWFGKPEGVAYPELLKELAPVVEKAGGVLWMRQMVLGPAPELCLHAEREVDLPSGLGALEVTSRITWPTGKG